jgi:acyl-CoA thioester hydrolase
MSTFTKEINIRWADLDPNFHVRHSAYYDFWAQHRVEIRTIRMSMRVMQEHFWSDFISRRMVLEEKCEWINKFYIYKVKNKRRCIAMDTYSNPKW